ncbi:MAG: hypothetical protein HRT60_05995, partial [Dinoroseobacter sp.]|nr:hypothetical protein [Dinoroseobacter sp.]
MAIETRVLRGNSLSEALDDVAALRISVFRDWPYLYDGDKEYERRYLSVYAENSDAILIGAFDGERLIGAATGTPLEDHADDFAAPFAETSLALEILASNDHLVARISLSDVGVSGWPVSSIEASADKLHIELSSDSGIQKIDLFLSDGSLLGKWVETGKKEA